MTRAWGGLSPSVHASGSPLARVPLAWAECNAPYVCSLPHAPAQGRLISSVTAHTHCTSV